MRKVFLEELPHGGYGLNDNVINWKNSIGHKVKFIYDDINGYIEILNYNTKTNKLKIKYNNKEYNIYIGTLLSCELGNVLCKITKNFKIEIGQTFRDDKRDLTIIDREYRGRYKYYKYKCNKCGWDEGWLDESKLLHGTGCSCCAKRTMVVGINTLYDTDPWIIPYIGEEVAKRSFCNSKEKIYPICPYCGRKSKKKCTIKSIYYQHGFKCSCSDNCSKISKFIFCVLEQLLEQNKINDFELEKKYNWNRYVTFDKKEHQASIDFIVYLNNREIPIEADGGFHRQDNTMNGQTKEESQYIDKQRDNNCLKYLGEETIRISDKGNIKQNILNSKLSELVDLSKINWNKALEYSCSNLIKIACEYKKNNPNLTASEIGKLMNRHNGTIVKWLKIGNELGWCNYNAKEESSKSSKINSSIPIICLQTGQIFLSAKECERQSLDIFNKQLKARSINSVCNNQRKTHKGYSFKKIKDLTEEEYIKYDIENKLKELKIWKGECEK